MMKLKEAKIGMSVIYTPYKACKPEDKELGVITSMNNIYVFVRYEDECISKATRPEDIEPTEEI